ncbi:MAG: DegV family protein [Firmicutes bacterium]|jgi:DegV family protein with EDD domain|nr:DegV family protein [Bacillota bacterium]MDH7496719.1 DegV family protein [Bacillota bacterium]
MNNNEDGGVRSGIAIVTDSGASLPEELVEQYEIAVAPIGIQFGTESYRDGVDITREEFYEKLDGPDIPMTSQPAPAEFISIYRRLLQRVKTIISIHITSTGSGTFQVANLAKASFPDADIEVVDSLSASMGTGFMVLAAAEAARRGKTKEEILGLLAELRPRINAYAVIKSVKHLLKSGRIHKGQALIASLLAIKPLVSVKEGVVEVVDRVRTYHAAIERLIEVTKEAAGDSRVRVSVVHGNALAEAKRLRDRLRAALNCSEIIISDIGPPLAVHGGPGIIGVVFHPV